MAKVTDNPRGIKVETLEEAQQAINMLGEFVFANSVLIGKICYESCDPHLWREKEEWDRTNQEIKDRYLSIFKGGVSSV